MLETKTSDQDKIYDVQTCTLHRTQDHTPYMKEMLEMGWEFMRKETDVKLPHGGYVDKYWFRKLKKQ